MNANFNVFPNNFNFMPNQNFNPFFFNNQNMLGINNNFNNFNGQNFMNNQIPMMQMNQFIMQNMNNMSNINNQNNIFNFKNQNQKLLVDKIINFYQNNKRKYMNYNEPNQIKQLLNNLDTNNPMLKEANDITDPLPYIEEKKKLIKFINHNFQIFNVKVPISIDKMTLYDIASLYKISLYSEILLIYMNCILNKDESSIDSISDGDFVIIIESIYYLDDSYFNFLKNINFSGDKINIPIKNRSLNLITLKLPSDFKLSYVIKALMLHFGCDYMFYYKSKYFHGDDNNIDDTEISEGYSIECIEHEFVITRFSNFGKRINLKVKLIKSKDKDMFLNYTVGLLNSVKELVKDIEFRSFVKVKAFYLGKRQINFKEDKSFASLGLKDNSEVTIHSLGLL